MNLSAGEIEQSRLAHRGAKHGDGLALPGGDGGPDWPRARDLAHRQPSGSTSRLSQATVSS